MPPTCYEFTAGEENAGMRLDLFLAEVIEDASRSFLQKVIRGGGVTVEGQVCKRPSHIVAVDERIVVTLPPPPSTTLEPEPIPLDILFEDASLVVVNKPQGLVVHPAPGHYTGTLVHAVLHRCAGFRLPGGDPLRPGIVHRLDRFTSGVIVVAKTSEAHEGLSEQARAHTFGRRYLALVQGEFPEAAGRIDAAVGRSIADPARMAVTGIRSRTAITHFKVCERFGVASYITLKLETGRTHQIRVHLRFAGRPVLGDPVYGVTDYRAWPIAGGTRAALEALPGQALHAETLEFVHPVTGEVLSFSAPPPEVFQKALDALRKEATG